VARLCLIFGPGVATQGPIWFRNIQYKTNRLHKFLAIEIGLSWCHRAWRLPGPQPAEQSENACMLGANIGPFWILQQAHQGFELILSGSAHDLMVLARHSNGHREIRLFSMTAISVTRAEFTFDGKKYRFHGSRTKPILRVLCTVRVIGNDLLPHSSSALLANFVN
jgi:hypothetical protein